MMTVIAFALVVAVSAFTIADIRHRRWGDVAVLVGYCGGAAAVTLGWTGAVIGCVAYWAGIRLVRLDRRVQP